MSDRTRRHPGPEPVNREIAHDAAKRRYFAHLRLPLGRTIGMADRRIGGVTVGGIIVIVGILLALFVSIILGVIVALVGLIAFGGFVRGRWY
jgi:hypothetical protein